jgi:uncharacterized protein (TIGR03437 family)
VFPKGLIMRHLRSFLVLLLASAGLASAQITITNVTNAGSRLPRTSPFGGVAQGALFVVTGRGVGPADFQQATFPLPTTAGLGGVTVQASVGGAIVDGIMVYVSSTEVAAILPSSTPLGTGTVTVNNNGATATAPITVVASAFGIFTLNYGFGAGIAAAFNVSPDDGSASPNGAKQSLQPGQDVLINGTGLGAITSDETQSGVTDVPNATLRVYVGVKPATVVSAARGACCDGLDPGYRVPRGIAAWDVIRITIPDGVTGCFVPVVVIANNFVSNVATVSVAASGSVCTPAVSTVPPEITAQLAGKTGASIGAIGLGRATTMSVTAAGAITTRKIDSGSAAFVRYPNLPASVVAADYLYPENVCSVNGYPGPNGGVTVNGVETPIVPQMAVGLDAGSSMTVKGPSGTRAINKRTVGMFFDYPGVTFGDTTPGNYFDPGRYTVTGSGGKDVGAFTGSTDVPPTPFVWTNIPNPTTPIDRSKDLTVTWTGGIPNTQVTVTGGGLVNGVGSDFLCAAPVSAGTITIPSHVLLQLPAAGSSIVPLNLGVHNSSVSTFSASGLDVATIRYTFSYTLSLRYQ